jgi:hypothetical protein
MRVSVSADNPKVANVSPPASRVALTLVWTQRASAEADTPVPQAARECTRTNHKLRDAPKHRPTIVYIVALGLRTVVGTQTRIRDDFRKKDFSRSSIGI